MAAAPRSIDAYLAGLDPAQRAALQLLRERIQAAAPRAEECISYGLPAFRQDRPLVAFGAAKAHCAFYPMSPAVVAAHAAELALYDTSKGTIRFPADRPLPAALVRKLIKARLAELAATGTKSRARAAQPKTPARASRSATEKGARSAKPGARPAKGRAIAKRAKPARPKAPAERTSTLAKGNAPAKNANPPGATRPRRARPARRARHPRSARPCRPTAARAPTPPSTRSCTPWTTPWPRRSPPCAS